METQKYMEEKREKSFENGLFEVWPQDITSKANIKKKTLEIPNCGTPLKEFLNKIRNVTILITIQYLK